MYFTRTDKAMRGWFHVIKSDGTLRTGLTSGSFTVTVVKADDSSTTIPYVSESSQLPGLYRFDVPAAFLSGSTGDYGISIQINAPAPGRVVSAFSKVLKVTQEDWDSMSGSIWNTVASDFNISGTMGYKQNNPGDISVSASVDVPSIVSGVWNANAATFNASGTMGWMQNKVFEVSSSVQSITVSSASISSIVNSIWNEGTSSYISSGTFGFEMLNLPSKVWDELLDSHTISGSSGLKLTQVYNNLFEIYQILGLDINTPMTQSTSFRRAGPGISQSFDGDPTAQIIVTRLP